MLWIGTFLGYVTGDSKRKTQSNTDERRRERQQNSSVTRDTGYSTGIQQIRGISGSMLSVSRMKCSVQILKNTQVYRL